MNIKGYYRYDDLPSYTLKRHLTASPLFDKFLVEIKASYGRAYPAKSAYGSNPSYQVTNSVSKYAITIVSFLFDPKGSILAPLLFLHACMIYINNIANYVVSSHAYSNVC